MSNDLIAWVVGITLGIAVVGLGLRRNLDDLTRRSLPRFGEATEPTIAVPGSSDGGNWRRPLSPGQKRFAIWAYLLFSVYSAALAVVSANNRLLHAIGAATFAIGAAVLKLKRSPLKSAPPPSS